MEAQQANIQGDALGAYVAQLPELLFVPILLAAHLLLVLIVGLILPRNTAFGKLSVFSILSYLAVVLFYFIYKPGMLGIPAVFQSNAFMHYAFLLLIPAQLIGHWLFLKDKEVSKQNELEYLIAFLAIGLGTVIAVGADHWILLVVALELIGFSGYFLVARNAEMGSGTAAFRYFLFGAALSSLMIYGIAGLLEFTFDLQIYSGAFYSILHKTELRPLIYFGMIALAVFFKLGLVPLHTWVPNAYSKASYSVVYWISVPLKIGVFLLVLRLADFAGINSMPIYSILGVLALASLFLGNLSALVQSGTRLLLAFAAISQSGFFLLFTILPEELALERALFYFIAYTLAFGSLVFLLSKVEAEKKYDLESLNEFGIKHPFWGIALLISLFSLIGLPPLMGFLAKFFLFSGIWEVTQNSESSLLLWVFILGLLNTVLALAYYLKLPYHMYFKKSGEKSNLIATNVGEIFVIVLLILLLIIGFFFPSFYTSIISNWNE